MMAECACDALQERVKELEAENSALAASACTDNMTGDERGHCICKLQAERDWLREELRAESLNAHVSKEACSAVEGFLEETEGRLATAEAKLAQVESECQRLLNKVNRVTVTWRHKGLVNGADLDALSNRQIEVEAALADAPAKEGEE